MRASRKGGMAISTPLSLRGFPKGSRGNLNPSVIARLPSKGGVAISTPLSLRGFPKGSRGNPSLLSLRASQQGRRGNLVLRLLRRYAPRNDNGIDCLCEASRREARGNLNPSVIASLPKGGVAIYFSDCFVATPLAMTMG